MNRHDSTIAILLLKATITTPRASRNTPGRNTSGPIRIPKRHTRLLRPLRRRRRSSRRGGDRLRGVKGPHLRMRKVQCICGADAALRKRHGHAWSCNGVIIRSHCPGLFLLPVRPVQSLARFLSRQLVVLVYPIPGMREARKKKWTRRVFSG